MVKDFELIIFQGNIDTYINENVNRTIRSILNVLDALYPADDKRAQLRKVVLDSVNELGNSVKTSVANIGKGLNEV